MISLDSIYDMFDAGMTAAEIKAKVDEVEKDIQEQNDKEEEAIAARDALATAFADYLIALDIIDEEGWDEVSTEVFNQFEEFEDNLAALKKVTNKSKTEKAAIAEENYEKTLRELVEDILSL